MLHPDEKRGNRRTDSVNDGQKMFLFDESAAFEPAMRNCEQQKANRADGRGVKNAADCADAEKQNAAEKAGDDAPSQTDERHQKQHSRPALALKRKSRIAKKSGGFAPDDGANNVHQEKKRGEQKVYGVRIF